MSRQKLSNLIFPLLLSLILLLSACDNPPANTIIVGCNVQDLIQAINTANQNPDHTEIHLGYCLYTLTEAENSATVDGITVYNGLPAITTEITIRAVSSAVIEIQKDPGEPDFGHFFITSTGTLNLYPLLISDGVRPRGGSVVNNGGDFFASDVTFVNNTASTVDQGQSALGGAIYSTDGRVRLIDGCHFQENITVSNGSPGANHGGAIYIKNGGLVISHSSFLLNEADGDGGAIYSLKQSGNDEGSVIQISDTDFRQSTAAQNGGAIAIIGDLDAVIIVTSYFGMGQAGNFGGAIYSEESEVVADHNDFRGNTASYGGAIYAKRLNEGDSSSYQSEYSNYDFNSASEIGGAIFSENADLELKENHFADNSAASCGAIRNGGSPGLDIDAGDLGTAPFVNSSFDLTKSNFDRNLATTSHGGAICHVMGEMYIGDTTFIQNESLAFGGAALLLDDAELVETAFLSNSADNGAGLMIGFPVLNHNSADSSISYLDFQSSLNNCWFSTNIAAFNGGGIYAHHKGSLTVANTSLVANSGLNIGGGIYQREGDLIIRNSTLSGNQAFRGGGLYAEGEGLPVPQLEINHVTLAHNNAHDTSGGSRAGGGGLNINGDVTSENALVVLNIPDDCTQGQSLISSLSHNIDSDQTCGFWQTEPTPQLGPVNGIVHPILTGSPLIDILPGCGLPVDQLGTSRPQGSGCEPGSYEYDASNPMDIPPMSDSSDSCDPFAGMEVSLHTLGLPEGTMQLPVVLRVDGEIPGLNPEAMNGTPLNVYRAQLGDIQSYKCGLQGYPDRLICMFQMPSGSPGLALNFLLTLDGCDDQVYFQPMLSIPEPEPEKDSCQVGLNAEDCKKAGGSYHQVGRSGTYECECP